MKKTALLLGSLLVVGATASAKEVAPAPVVQQEPQVVEVVVIKEAPKVWKPNGSADLSYRYYGQDEHGSGDFGRTQFSGTLNTTETQQLQWRVRSYNTYKHFTFNNERDYYNYGDKDDIRFRYFFKQGNLGDTKIGLTHRFQYQAQIGRGTPTELAGTDINNTFKDASASRNVEYMARFQFSPYFSWTPEWFKVTNFTFAPRYRYSWTANNDNYTNTIGTDLYTYFEMPYGFEMEVNLYPQWIDYGQKDKNDVWKLNLEAYLYWSQNLYQNGPFAIAAQFEGGFDPYSTGSKKTFGKLFSSSNARDTHSYQLYALPELKATYQATEFMKLYATAGAEYRNWEYTKAKSARDWRWMPIFSAGFNVKF